MAEFNEVVKQLGRICESNFWECNICDLRPFCPSKALLDFDCYAKSGRAERLEEMVMKWAAEHEEPKYPTWFEYLYAISNPDYFDLTEFYTWMRHTPIPAGIAEKLEIEPKEG